MQAERCLGILGDFFKLTLANHRLWHIKTSDKLQQAARVARVCDSFRQILLLKFLNSLLVEHPLSFLFFVPQPGLHLSQQRITLRRVYGGSLAHRNSVPSLGHFHLKRHLSVVVSALDFNGLVNIYAGLL